MKKNRQTRMVSLRRRRYARLSSRVALALILLATCAAVLALGGLLPWEKALPRALAQSRVGQNRIANNGNLPQSIAQDQQLSAEAISQIVALENEKASRTPTEQKIDSQLLQALRESRGLQMTAGVRLERANVNADSNGILKVDIDAQVTDDLITRIEALGGEIIFPSWKYNTIRALVKLSVVDTIAGYGDVRFIQPAIASLTSRTNDSGSKSAAALDRSVLNSSRAVDSPYAARPSFAERAARVRSRLSNVLGSRGPMMPLPTGTVNSQGDRTHRADDTRNTYGYSGQGIRIGVLSDSYNALGGAAADVASGNLPGVGNPLGNATPVTVVQDFAGGADEGRAMLQIVHDLAPKAQLFFATADVSEASFATNITALRNAPNNCDIVIDDVFYFDEPVFQDGIVAQAVNGVTASGGLYFSSAGNEGNVAKNTAGYFEGDFNDAGSPAFTFPGGAKAGTIHNFGTVGSPINGDIITSAGQRYTLNWADPVNASNNDYDLFLLSSGGTVKASSTNIQNGSQLAFEQIAPPALAAGDRLVVFKTNAAAVRAFAINTIRGALTIKTIGQTHGHSSAVDAFSVAATPAGAPFSGITTPGPFPGAFSGANQVEAFTSDGPRRIFFDAAGNPITPGNFLFGTNGGTVRNKPDITAADGVSTTLAPASGLNPFYGTSASAPHAGAIAGLLKSANPALTPAQIRTILTTTAVDVETAGYDNLSGFGIVQTFQAMQAVAPTPQANITLGTVTQTEGAFSNGNGFVDPGELGNLTVQLTNPSLVSATSVNATLTTSTPGITITQGSASYGTINASSSAANASPYVFGVNSTSVTCGTTISFTLTVTFGGGFSPQVFQFSTVVGNQPFLNINGTLGSPAPSVPGATSTSGQQTGRLSRSGVQATCAAVKANPGLTATTGSRQFDAYTFTNTNASTQCVAVTLTAANGTNLYTVAYNGAGFVPSNPSTNFLADPGASSSFQSYSFNVAPGATFTVVVHDINPLPASGSAYTLSVSLATCSAGPACTPITVSPGSIPSGATGTPYSQSFSASGASGAYAFALTGGLPNGLNFSGNTLSGTPTQAGSFPITVTANDAAGCPAGSHAYSLVIAGNAPASLAIAGGDGQTTVPGTAFANPLQAIVRDGGSNPLGGVSVTFTAPNSGASGTFPGNSLTATVATDVNGIATAPTFTANTTTGAYQVTASVNALPSVNFNLSNNCPASFVVTSSADDGPGTLRSIVTNACPGITVTFDPSVTLITLTSGEILVTKAITITGPGANLLTVSGNNLSRIFNIAAGASTVSISGMTLRDGKPTGGTTGGGAILINNGSAVGPVNLTNCIISNNDATLAGNPLGGGIDNEGGTVAIDRCSIVNNIATFRGGGIQNQGFGSMAITNSTIAGNTAGFAGVGGGIRSLLNLTLTNDTFFGNSAQTAGNISRPTGTITFKNTIIAGGFLVGSGGTSPDLSGTAGLISADYNLIQNTTGATIAGTTTHNITGVSPNLSSLGNHGGPTPTLLPQTNSVAINAGDPTASGSDQRGFPRLVGPQPDIGAVETNYTLAATGGTPQTAGLNLPFAIPLQATVQESGNGISGVTVNFTAPAAGASGFFPGPSTTASAVTVGGGIATAPTFTANNTVGSYSVNADIGSVVGPANFNLTNAVLADVSISQTDSPDPVTANSNLTYLITTHNSGPNDAANTSTSDTLPASTSLVSFVQDTGPPNGGTLPVGQTQTFTLVVHVNAGTPSGTVLTNTANVSTTSTDPNLANNSSTETTTVFSPQSKSWTSAGSTGTIDEDSVANLLVEGSTVRLKDGLAGTGTIRYNITATEGISAFCPASQSTVKVRFRNTDDTGVNSRVKFEIHRTSVVSGGNTVIYTFDSNGQGAGNAFTTVTATPAIDFDFSNFVYWIEATVFRNDAVTQQADLDSIEIYESAGTACP